LDDRDFWERVQPMDRIAVVAGALLAFGGVTHVQQGQRPPASKVEAEGLPEEFKQKLADYVLNAQSHLAGEQFGLKPPEPAQFWLRIRTPKRGEAIFAGPMIYTAGTAALTMYARSPSEALNGSSAFDPVFSVLDATAETAWATRIKNLWLIPSAIRNGLDRHLSQKLAATLDQEAEKDKGAPRWPGTATPRKGSFEALPPGHPLVQDRDRVVDLFDRFENREGGHAELVRILTWCSDNQASGAMATAALEKLLAPVLAPAAADGPTSLLPDAEFATREPWQATNKDALALRMNGLGGDASPTAIQMRLTYGEQRATPTDFQDWNGGGAPTLLFHPPRAGTWTISGVEVCARRTVGEKDDAADRLISIVVLDERFHELFRCPFAQTAIPVGTAGWVKLPISSSPALPKEFWFLALEAEDPGPGAKLEICVRPGALGEHSFRSVPNRKLSGQTAPVDKATGAVQPVDFAVYVDHSGRDLERRMTPMIAFEDLKKWSRPTK
jgi:hypothetical protein